MYGLGVLAAHGQLQAAQQQLACVQWSSAPSWKCLLVSKPRPTGSWPGLCVPTCHLPTMCVA